MCPPSRREFRALGRRRDARLPSIVRSAGKGITHQYRGGGEGRNAALAAPINCILVKTGRKVGCKLIWDRNHKKANSNFSEF
jgi:hypothetical protein